MFVFALVSDDVPVAVQMSLMALLHNIKSCIEKSMVLKSSADMMDALFKLPSFYDLTVIADLMKTLTKEYSGLLVNPYSYILLAMESSASVELRRQVRSTAVHVLEMINKMEADDDEREDELLKAVCNKLSKLNVSAKELAYKNQISTVPQYRGPDRAESDYATAHKDSSYYGEGINRKLVNSNAKLSGCDTEFDKLVGQWKLIKDKIKQRSAMDHGDSRKDWILLPHVPITSDVVLKKFVETAVTDKVFRGRLETCMKSLGGRTVHDFFPPVLDALFSQAYAMQVAPTSKTPCSLPTEASDLFISIGIKLTGVKGDKILERTVATRFAKYFQSVRSKDTSDRIKVN